MQNVLVAAVPASQPNTSDVSTSADYFEILGAPRAFRIDLSAVEKRFYELSRTLHPDRYSGAGAEALKASLEKMSVLNQAYSTLKSVELRREYLLGLEGIELGLNGATQRGQQMPMDLAEAWFEIQDLMTEDPSAARAALSKFAVDLQATIDQGEKEIQDLEAAYDSSHERELLERIAKRLQTRSYLKSMQRDVTGREQRLS